MRTDNKTLFGIKDNSERYPLAMWLMTVVITSLIGDTIILIGTIKYKAIKQHKAIVATIQHMAIYDLLLCVLRVFPSGVAVIADRWVFGETFCHIEENVKYLGNTMTMFLTAILTTLKLVIVKYPLKAGTWASRLGHILCLIPLLISIGGSIPTLIVNMSKYIKPTIHFTYEKYDCDYQFPSPQHPAWFVRYNFVSGGVLMGITYPALVITSVLLLIVAKKVAAERGDMLRWEGVTTVLLTVVVFFISSLPMTVVLATNHVGVIKYSYTVRRVVVAIQYINIMANFFIYSLTLRSFRKFLRERFYRIFYPGVPLNNHVMVKKARRVGKQMDVKELQELQEKEDPRVFVKRQDTPAY